MALETLTELVVQALYLVLWVSAPAIVSALVVGAAMGVLSSATQVQEPTVSYVPKLVGVGVALALFGGWMATRLVGFTEQLWLAIPALV